jgi:hypothetical protein
MGANNHTTVEREKDDFYATPPLAVKELINNLQLFNTNIREPCCGMNHITNILREKNYNVRTSDISENKKDSTNYFDPLIYT